MMSPLRRYLLGAAFLAPTLLAGQAPVAKRAERAMALPLFASHAPLEFTLSADFRTLSRDRDTLSTKRYPGTLRVVGDSADTLVVPVQLRTRGHYRLLQRNCPFVPLRVEFPREKGPDAVSKTVFAGQTGLKLVTHCRSDGRYEQYVYREEMVYRLHNLVTPLSFRSRLASVTYQDTTGKSLGKYPAFFIEDERDVGRRNGGKIAELRGGLFDDLEPKEAARLALFQYMIGNTDWSIYSLHNIRLLVIEGQPTYIPIAYDFDFTGLVDTHYATPDPRLRIRDVQQRLYRGGCTHNAHIPEIANEFLAIKQAALALYDSATWMDRGAARDAKSYLSGFFETIGSPHELKASVLDRCVRNPGM